MKRAVTMWSPGRTGIGPRTRSCQRIASARRQTAASRSKQVMSRSMQAQNSTRSNAAAAGPPANSSTSSKPSA